MNVVGHIKADMAPVQKVMDGLGVTARGDVQKFHTANVRRRIQKYMPYRSGATIKLMIAQSPVNEPFLHVNVPYARMLYYGKVMVGRAPKRVTDRPLKYIRTEKSPLAGPRWDRRLVSAEGKLLARELQSYLDRRKRP